MTSARGATESQVGTASGQALPPELNGSRAVDFETADGVQLEGRVFGGGLVGVVLAHIADRELGQGEWFSFAPVLARHGYRALTFDFRGICPGGANGCSASGDDAKTWLDIAASVAYLRAQGAAKVFVVGAGLGGHVALYAASRPGQDYAGVAELGAPEIALGPRSVDLTRALLVQVAEPKLFMAGRSAVEAGYDPSQDAAAMYAAASQPKQLAVFPGDLTGDVLVEANPRARKTLLAFLTTHS